MTKDEIKEWNSNSILKGPFYHGTSTENAIKIKKEGFNLQEGEYGKGVYLTKFLKKAEMFSTQFASPEVIEAYVNVKNSVDKDQWDKLNDKYGLNLMAYKRQGGKVVSILKELGYDSIDASYISRVYRGKEQSHQLIIFDSKNVVALKVENKSLGLSSIFKGGPGSGNFGHSGRPGEVGGSGEGSFGDGILNLTPQQLADSKRANEILDKDVFRGDPKFVHSQSFIINNLSIENKKFVQRELTDKLQDSEYFEENIAVGQTKGEVIAGYIRSSIDEWSGTSGDSNKYAIATQLIVQKVFKIDDASVDHFDKDATGKLKKDAEIILESKGFVDRKSIFLQAQYDVTQKYFKDNNIKELILYRGVEHNDGGKLRTEDVFLQPMSSFSTKANIALHFAKITTEDVTLSYRGTLYSSIVPVEKILSHPRTGFGCTNEKEVVVLGGKMKATVVPTKIARDVYLTATAAPNSSGTFNDRFIDALSKVTPEFRKEIGLSRIFKHFEGTEYDHNQSTHGGAIGQRNKTD